MTLAEHEVILEKARAVQAKQVMPLIGPLLDQWNFMMSDIKGALREDAPFLCEYLDKIDHAMCADIGNP